MNHVGMVIRGAFSFARGPSSWFPGGVRFQARRWLMRADKDRGNASWTPTIQNYQLARGHRTSDVAI